MPYADAEKRRAFAREYVRRPEVREKRRLYVTRPEYMEAERERHKIAYSNPETRSRIRSYQRKYYSTRQTITIRYQRYQYDAKVRNIEFTLTQEQFAEVVDKQCHYCGSKGLIGIDRKDNSLGYTPDNSLPSCKVCNYQKRTMSYESYIAHCKKVSSIHS